PHWVPGRKGAFNRQHFRVLRHAVVFRGARTAAAPGPVLGNSRRPGDAGCLYRGRRRSTPEGALAELRFAPVPGVPRASPLPPPHPPLQRECIFLSRLVRRAIPSIDEYRGGRFIVVEGGRCYLTRLALVLMAVEGLDVVFAVDSIPAIFAVTSDPFIIYTS